MLSELLFEYRQSWGFSCKGLTSYYWNGQFFFFFWKYRFQNSSLSFTCTYACSNMMCFLVRTWWSAYCVAWLCQLFESDMFESTFCYDSTTSRSTEKQWLQDGNKKLGWCKYAASTTNKFNLPWSQASARDLSMWLCILAFLYLGRASFRLFTLTFTAWTSASAWFLLPFSLWIIEILFSYS